MINRLLIRIKVLQILYSYYHSDSTSDIQAVSTLDHALEKSYQLYLYLCSLPMQVAKAAAARMEVEQSKIAPDPKNIEILNHYMDNALVRFINSDDAYMEKLSLYTLKSQHLDDYIYSTVNHELTIVDAEGVDWNDLEVVKERWKAFYKKSFQDSDEFHALLEELSTYINDDITIVFTFVTKLFNAVGKEKDYLSLHRPQYSSNNEQEFGHQLLKMAIQHKEEYRNKISEFFKNWDRERVSEMDFIILQLAMTEAINFPDIAVSVIINEYLNLARYYSSPNSTVFLNGIMHHLFTALKEEGQTLR